MTPFAWYKRWGTGKNMDYEILLHEDADRSLKKNAKALYTEQQAEKLCMAKQAALLADVRKFLYAMDYVGLIQHMKHWADWKEP